jgi:hypothetical protein
VSGWGKERERERAGLKDSAIINNVPDISTKFSGLKPAVHEGQRSLDCFLRGVFCHSFHHTVQRYRDF